MILLSLFSLNNFFIVLNLIKISKTETIDENSDNVVDKIKIKLTFQSDPSTIQNIKLMLFLDYALTVK